MRVQRGQGPRRRWWERLRILSHADETILELQETLRRQAEVLEQFAEVLERFDRVVGRFERVAFPLDAVSNPMSRARRASRRPAEPEVEAWPVP